MPTYVAVFRSGETVRTQKLSLPERFDADDLPGEKANPSGPAD